MRRESPERVPMAGGAYSFQTDTLLLWECKKGGAAIATLPFMLDAFYVGGLFVT